VTAGPHATLVDERVRKPTLLAAVDELYDDVVDWVRLLGVEKAVAVLQACFALVTAREPPTPPPTAPAMITATRMRMRKKVEWRRPQIVGLERASTG
jgi:hypothetical protein